jgi:hypothetical protein
MTARKWGVVNGYARGIYECERGKLLHDTSSRPVSPIRPTASLVPQRRIYGEEAPGRLIKQDRRGFSIHFCGRVGSIPIGSSLANLSARSWQSEH